jgi:protein-S-isoprenylcysteine O-methyltransferase Ste14
MSARAVGWLLVGVQGGLLATLVLLPSRDDWPTPPAIQVTGVVLVVAGVVGGIVAARRLGSALTPTPEPRSGDSLRTDGLYAHVRHPIYTAVLVLVVGIVVRSGSLPTAAVGLVTVVFFQLKARWEEARLRARYPDYDAYAAHTPRFVPRPPLAGRRNG